ncbi:hypothetical protein SLA2020_339580 [Shorea laevis]
MVKRRNPKPSVEAKPSGKTVKLRTADGEIFEVEEAVAMELRTVKIFFEDDGVPYDTAVPLLNVLSAALAKVIRYCRRAVEFSAKSAEAGDDEGAMEKVKEERKAFEAEFVSDESNEALKELILAAHYLNIEDMLSLLNQTVADRIKNKSVEYVRGLFGIENNFSPEEEERLRQENAWAFEGVDAD